MRPKRKRCKQRERCLDATTDTMLIQLLVAIFVLWRIYRLVRRRRAPSLPPRKHWALALAQPFVDATQFAGFASPGADTVNEATRFQFRAQLLHQMRVRTDASDEDVRGHLAYTFESHWYRADLNDPLPADEPRAALAFACARMAFFARTAMLLQWVEPEIAWRVLLLNAQRAQDCFASWHDFGQAFVAGRRQWVAAFRSDPFGKEFDDDALRGWLNERGAWRNLPWPGLAAFSPEPATAATCARTKAETNTEGKGRTK